MNQRPTRQSKRLEEETAEDQRTVLPPRHNRPIRVPKVRCLRHPNEKPDLEDARQPAPRERLVSSAARWRGRRAASYILMRCRSSAGSRMYGSEKTASMTKLLFGHGAESSCGRSATMEKRMRALREHESQST